MLKKICVYAVCVFFLTASSYGQSHFSAEGLERMYIMEDSLVLSADSMFSAYIPDSRLQYCERFVKQLLRALKVQGSYHYEFSKLAKKINIVYPDDKNFRIFNWSISPSEVTMRYYGAIQMPEDQLKLFPLVDYTDELGKTAEDSILTGNKWYGALYYRIITHEVNGAKVYTMLGKNASNPISNKKVMDPMMITADGVVFGMPIFNINNTPADAPGRKICRFILEYKKDVHAALNWDEERKLVIFDKLVSQVNDPKRKYTYVPSGQYDGFQWENESWNYVSDLIPVQNLKDGEAPSGINPQK